MLLPHDRTHPFILAAAAAELLIGTIGFAVPTGLSGLGQLVTAGEIALYLPGAFSVGGLLLLMISRQQVPPWLRQISYLAAVIPVGLTAWSGVQSGHLAESAFFGGMGVLAAVTAWGVWTVTQRRGGPLHPPDRVDLPLAPVPEQVPADPFPFQLDLNMVPMLWWVALLLTMVNAFVGRQVFASPLAVQLLVVAVALYAAAASSLKWRAESLGQRLTRHLRFLTGVLAFLLTQRAALAYPLMALLAVVPGAAARTMGRRAGRSLQALGLAAAAAGAVWIGSRGGQTAGDAFLDAVISIGLLAASASFLIHLALEHRRHLTELSAARDSLRLRVEEMEMFGRIGSAIRHSLDLDEILQTTVTQLRSVFRAGRCFLWLREEHGTPAEYDAPEDGGAELNEETYRRLAVLVRENDSPVATADLHLDPRFSGFQPAPSPGNVPPPAHSVLAAPLIVNGQLLGILGLSQTGLPRNWSAAEQQFLTAMAGQVAVAAQHARVHRALTLRHVELQRGHSLLQAQDQELQSQGEELLAQSETLREQGTRLHHQNEELRTREETYRTLIEKMQEGFCVVVDAAITLANDYFANMVGRTADDLVGIEFLNLVAPEERAMVREKYRRRLSGGAVPAFELTLVDPSGENRRTVYIRAGTIPYNGGIALLVTMHDITERKRIEQALRDSEERYRLLVELSPDAIAIGKQGRLVFANDAARKLLGVPSADDLSSHEITEFVAPQAWADVRGRIDRMLAGNVDEPLVQARLRRLDGQELDAELAASLMAFEGTPAIQIVARDVTERKRVERQLLHLANYDSLTGLFNRHRFQEELQSLLDAGGDGAILFMDLDQFKYVNDSLGHPAGDSLLKSVAELLRSQVRHFDAIARLGGDEFAVLLPHTSAERAEKVAWYILKGLSRNRVPVGEQLVGITASIGVAMFPGHGTDVETLLARADVAMYQAKERGRNGVAMYADSMGQAVLLDSKLAWERRIWEALDEDRLVLHCQPIVNLRTGQVAHYELLLRMVERDGQLVLPGEFLPVAERFGLINRIDRWVVRRAIHLLAEKSNGGCELPVEVNISAKAFADSGLLALIRTELDATGVSPCCLVVEITETSAIADIEQARVFVDTLKELGCRFAIDDFGSGFA